MQSSLPPKMSDIPNSPETENIENDLKPPKRKLGHVEPGRKSKKPARDLRRGLTDSSFEETEYYIEGYLRKVYPYYFTYTTFCKGRWVGRKLIDVFSEEFRAHSKEEYEKTIKAGNIKINGSEATADYIFKENDHVTNRSHRHETAVVASPIKLIQCDDDFVVIDKPPSVPVHPCGRYRHNCLIFILAKEHNLRGLHSVHRLDRLTSGIMVFTKTISKAQQLNEQIRERKVQKEYVCRVTGNFPDGVITCNEAIETISPKMGICIPSLTGKECQTVFQKLSFNGKSSVVSCKPLTGRMHQIRVHLQYLGHPIINDPIYNHETAFGPNKGKNGDIGKSREQLLEDLLNTHNLRKWLLDDELTVEQKENESSGEKLLSVDNKLALHALESYMHSNEAEVLKKYAKCPEKIQVDPVCDLCHQKYMDPEPKDLILFLHALKYEGEGWSFEAEMPIWAKDNWTEC